MLHIFHVDKGRMLSFEMNIALCKVIELKKKIATDLGIHVEKQVLLISGGTALYDNEFVCHYNGGTDSNPIFLFDLHSINTYDETTDLEAENADIKALEVHVKEQVELSVKQPPCANTVSSRAALSQDIYEFSRKQLNSANTIVLHQHLQQQGWGAVVANLEDILITLSKKTESFNLSIEEFLKIREDKIALLGRIEKDVDMLKKIPLLPSLRFSSSQQQCMVNFGSREHLAGRSGGSNTEEDDLENERNNMTSLYDWMCVNNLHDLLDRVNTRLANINQQYYYQHLQEYRSIHSDIKPEFKEIKGLGDRLSQLDNLLRNGNKHVEDQKFVAESFLQNQTRSGLLRDDSIYPNLCESQVQYIRKMLDNFLKVADIHRRCSRAKHELSYNIVSRLIWVTHIEEKVNNFLTKIDLHSGTMKNLKLNIKLLEQIHNAPKLYFKAISEVIRRQKFSKKFLHWTNQLSVESKEIWDKEVHTRKEIASQLSTHFLSTLFPGLNSDFIPAFATEKPKQFDEYLPQLSTQSLNILRESVPELSHILNVEDPVAVPHILEAGLRCNDNTNTLTPSSYGRDIASTDFFSSAVTSSVQGMKASFLHSQGTDEGPVSPKARHSSRPSSLLRDQPESETDTEEFEKVCGSISDETYSPLLECVPDTKSAKTKHSYPSKASDSKHIKLDSSQQSDETSVRRQPANTTRKMATLSPEPLTSPEEFESPDCFIDESMPYSYTESTCTTTTTSSSGVHRQHVPLAHQVSVNSQLSQQAIIAELQKQVDEKSVAILSFQDELENSQSQRETLQTRLNTLASLIHTVLQDLKKEMENLKGKVKEDETTYVKYISDVSTRILEVLEKIQKETEVGQQMAIESALNLAQMEADEKRNTLQAQLNDTSRELEIYQGQTRDYITQIDRLKALMQEGNAHLTAEKEETVKKLTLEHELEMEALKEKWHKEEKERVDEVTSLKESVSRLEEELSKSEDEKQNMSKSVEAKLEQKFQEKEVSIREILWAAYIEHENKSLESQKLELENAFNNERLRVEELHRNELVQKIGELKSSFEIESGKRLGEEREEAEKRHLEEIQKCRDLWEAQKEEEVEGKKEELKSQLKVEYDQKLETAKLQYKMDLEGLRSRFRMMTTASMDKSPSETSLEKFERGDFVDSTYHDVVMAKLREELQDEKDQAIDDLRKKLEEKHTLALRDERETYEEKRKDERRVLETEKQEILKEISQDKERVIEDLRLRVEFLTDETEKMRKINARTQEEARALVLPPNMQEWQEQCELYKKEIDRLNKEVQRAKRLSFVSEKHPDLFPEECPSPSPSVGSDVQVLEGSVQKLQQENRELRNALSNRICSERKRVSLDDAQVHDIVLIVWDDIYQQYRILLETNPILHFLHSDSYAELGLPKGSEKPEKLYCTAQVQKKKEFCQAKRDGNRFRVPRGTKFYRVQAGPIYTHVERPESAFMHHPKAPSGKEPTLEEGAVSDLEDTKSSLGSI